MAVRETQTVGPVMQQGFPSGVTVLVAGRRRVADEVVELVLADPGGGALPRWSVGSHIDVRVPTGESRQYSLCGDPADPTWTIAVLREPDGRGGSMTLCDRIDEGDRLQVGLPRNTFSLVAAAGYYFVAGGIGITPILPMVEEAVRTGVPVTVHYGGRRASAMAFRERLQSSGAEVTVYPEDQVGRPPLAETIGSLPDGWAVYCCGPPGLIVAAQEATGLRSGLSFRHERFAALDQPPADDAAGSYSVVLRRSGLTLQVAPGQTVLDCVEQAGVQVTQECREGICGACETAVLEGVPDHRDSILTDAERRSATTMFICVSGSRSDRLVLDL